jgi:phosphate transport system substrate-binding protein
MQRLNIFILFALFCAGLWSCNEAPKPTDTLSKGVIDIAADESYRPIIDEELKVFDSCYPDATINVHYKPEDSCFKDYFENKARIILVSRDLTKTEKDFCTENKIYNTSLPLALDAIAVIANNACIDTEMDINMLKGILTGTYKTKYIVALDNSNSSTQKFLADSILGGAALGSNVFAAKGNAAVLNYVKSTPNAIGFVGVSYISQPEDSSNIGGFISGVRVIALKNKEVTTIDNSDLRPFNKPYQAIIARKAYPLTRKLFYINRESYLGLGTGFANFLGREQGQLIFAHAHLFPLRMNIVIRDAAIKQ